MTSSRIPSIPVLLALAVWTFAARPAPPAPAAPPPAGPGLENRSLAVEIAGPDRLRLTNKLSGKAYDVASAPFELVLEAGGRAASVTAADFAAKPAVRPASDRLRIVHAGRGPWAGVSVEVEYLLPPDAWYVRKSLTVVNARPEPVTVRDAVVDAFAVAGVPTPEKVENPAFLDGQLFWGLEWPIAEAAVRAGRIAFAHFPGAAVAPGGTWTSKTAGFGVAAAGRVEEAFGRYIQAIRANRVDFATFYFDWLCHDNSGPRESEVLANFAALRRLKDLYGLQFDIYNSDAGLVESQGTYYPEFKANFLSRFPSGLGPIAAASSALGMRLGLWIGPDGFGETPESMAARRAQLLSWVKDFNAGLFKMDTVVSALDHKDKYVLEKKYQSLADALSEARRVDPKFVAINHRINNSPYMLTITDCLLWRGQETYIDVHISNRTASLYNRDCSIGRELTSSFYGTPFRQFEDHGICFNSCLEKWDDDLVAQAFGRASVLSPEMYGTFFFLGDADYPRLARLIQLHKQLEPLLKAAFPLPGGDIAHADGASSLVLVRNMSWEPAVKTIPLDASIGLAAAPGAPLTVRQRHPYEMLMTAAGDGAVDGGSLTVELDPFSLKLIQIDSLPPAEPFVTGVPYEIVPGPGDGRFGLKLLGRPGQKADVSLRGFGDRPVRTAAGIDVPTGDTPWAVAFPGAAAAGPSFARLADLRDDPAAAADGPHLTELAKFTLDDDALEIREMVRLRREPSSLAEIEACRAYMWDKVVAAEGTSRNAFDGDPGTRWSDGFPRRSRFTGSPVAYRSETSLWRIDLGKPTDLGRLELRVVRRTDAAVLEAVETSTDLRTWARVGGLSLAAADGIPFSAELKQRGQTIRVFDVDAGDKAPVAISVPLAGGPCRYVRIRGRNFGVAEIVGYDGAGKLLDRSGWKATNFLGETTVPRRVLTASYVPAEDAPGREYAVAVTAGPAKFDPVDGVYVVALVDGRAVVPRHRAPSYPYHNFEWNSGAPKLAGMTFRLPIDRAWKGKTVEFRVMMFGDGADGAQAVLRLVTPRPVFAELPLRVGAPGTVRPVPAPAPAPETRRLEPVPYSAVRIDDAFWAPRIARNRTVSIPAALKECAASGNIANFEIAAGLAAGQVRGSHAYDSDLYKVIEGAAYSLKIAPDPKLEAEMDRLIDAIAKAQEKDGYLNTHFAHGRNGPHLLMDPTEHELYCAGHVFEAGAAYREATGKRKLLDVAARFADLLDRTFGPGKRYEVSGHEEVELALVRLARATGERRYLDLARFFLAERGFAHGSAHRPPTLAESVLQDTLDPCDRRSVWRTRTYRQDHLPLAAQGEAVGHAVRAGYLYSAMADVAGMGGSEGYGAALDRIWQSVAGSKIYITGGVGTAQFNDEGFGTPYDLPNERAYCETCAAAANVFWNHRMNLLRADARYADVLELALYNGFLSGVSLSGDRFFYTNRLAGSGRDRRDAWADPACCPSNVVRTIPQIGGYVYGRDGAGIYVNLFVGGSADIPWKDGRVRIVQTTGYPWDGRVRIAVEPDRAAAFDLAVRVPGWASRGPVRSDLYVFADGLPPEETLPRFAVNGASADAPVGADGYVRLRRTWRKGDRVDVEIPLPVRRVHAHPNVAADRGRVALMRGPIVYCLEAPDQMFAINDFVLPADASVRVEGRPDLLGGVTVLRGEGRLAADGAPAAFTAIPYYAWANRAPGAMAVWLPEK